MSAGSAAATCPLKKFVISGGAPSARVVNSIPTPL